MKKSLLISLLVASLVVVGCNNNTSNNTNGSNNQNSSKVESPYTLKIQAVGNTTIKVTQTVTLRAQVVGTQEKDVTWTSADEKVATVSSRGIVTGISKGKVKIRATLNLDKNCYAEIEINVEDALTPTSITIEGFISNVGWVGESLQLNAVVLPENASNAIEWSSSDDSIASISNTGLLSYLKEGTVKIKAASQVDATVYDELDITVKKGIFNTAKSSTKWNFDNQSGENAYIDLGENAEASQGLNTAYFANIEATEFYAEVTFRIKCLTENTWDWQGIGIGSGISNSDGRFFTYSPHSPKQTANNFNKIILRDLPESWGALTTRSQVWGENSLDDIDIASDIKIAMLRTGNEYYYLINDKVYWYDINEKYDEIGTIPYIVAYDIPVKAFNYSVTTDETIIATKLASNEYQKSFFASNPNIVDYNSDSDFTFNNDNILSKDNKVRSLGDKAKLVRDFEIEFDVDSLTFNLDRSHFKGLTVNFSRYDSADVVDTIGIGKSGVQSDNTSIIGRFCKWDYTQSMEMSSSIKEWFETSQGVMAKDGEKHHIKITRTLDMDNEWAYFRLWVDGTEYTFDLNHNNTEGISARSRYMGAYLVWVAGEYSSSHVSNFVLRSNI